MKTSKKQNLLALLGCAGATLLVGLLMLNGCATAPQRSHAITPIPADSASGTGALHERSVGEASVATAPSPTEELWVISRPSGDFPAAGDASEGVPGCGSLLAKLPAQETEIPVPLKHTSVKAAVSGYIATVDVIQQFHNPYDQKIEAVYVFPLPENAAVNEFLMIIGQRQIRGIIREREEAERIYQDAKSQGYTASLLTQERPNVFTQAVANIEPGKAIDISIRYFHTLAYVDGWHEFVFPMVVGPRFNPPGFTDGIAATPRSAPGSTRQKTEVQHLAPNERSGHDIALELSLDAGVSIEETECRTHAIDEQVVSASQRKVLLHQEDSIPNKDFVFRYRVAGDQVKSAVMTHRDERGGFFTLMLYPPAELANLPRRPMELVFVLDSSGSMSGYPIGHAKKAIETGLGLLQPQDSFQIINFSSSASQLGPEPLAATPSNTRRGLKYLSEIDGKGGTMMIEGIKAALEFPQDRERLRFVCFLTDGYIGNETEIFGAVQKKLGAARVFSFGVGSSVNRYLLDGLARLGKGAVAYLGPKDSPAGVMEDFFDRVSHPAMTDLSLDWGDLAVTDVYPSELPDLFVGRSVILTGRAASFRSGAVKIRGRADGEEVTLAVPFTWNDTNTDAGIASVWARTRIADLDHQLVYSPNDSLIDAIRKVALDFSLVSQVTAFVAVDSSRRTAGDHGVTVAVPVPVPEGVRYDTTVP